MAQTFKEPICEVTGQPFCPISVPSKDGSSVQVVCSECDELLEEYER